MQRFFGPYAPEALPSHAAIFSHDFKRFERLTKLATSSFFPAGGLPAFWGCRHALTLEDIAHGLITDVIAPMSQGASQTVVAPAAIFLCHLDDQIFQCFINSGTSRQLALAGTIEFGSGECPLPGEDGVRLDDMGDFFQGFLPELSADLGQSQTLSVTELDTSLDLVT